MQLNNNFTQLYKSIILILLLKISFHSFLFLAKKPERPFNCAESFERDHETFHKDHSTKLFPK